jgi:hypothetical protein
MFLKCYHHLHPMTKSIGCVDQTSDEDFSLDIFQETASIIEPSKELVTKRTIVFQTLPSGSQKHPLQWWGNMKLCFLQLVFWLVKS